MSENANIITNPEAFSPAGIPEKLLDREKERSQLLSSIRNFANTVIIGGYGCGKTCLVKSVLKEYNELKEGRAVYIDCAIYQTTYSILKEVLPKGDLVLYRSNYELIRELRKYVKANRFAIVLDNFDQLKDRGLIGRFMSLAICVFLIADSEEGLAGLETSVRSNIASTIMLPKYTVDESVEILRSVAQKALQRWSFSDEVLRIIAGKIDGNITHGLNAIKAAAMKAENEGKRAIDEADIIIEEDCPADDICAEQRIILEVMAELKSLPAGQLYQHYLARALKPIGEKKGRIYEFVEHEAIQPG